MAWHSYITHPIEKFNMVYWRHGSGGVAALLMVGLLISRDQPNSREKMRDFTTEFLKCVKFHGKFTERVSQIHDKYDINMSIY